MSRAWRGPVAAAAGVVIVLVAAACGSGGSGGSGGSTSGSGSKTYTIGVLNALTGALGVVGQQEAQGMNLAVGQINAAGGVSGHKISLTTIDDQGSVNLSTAGLKRLVTSDHVPIVIGPGISASAAADAPLAEQYQVPEILMVAQPAVANGTKYIFETPPPQNANSQAMINYAKSLGVKSASLIWASNPYGQLGNSYINTNAPKAGITMKGSESWDPTAFDFTAQATKVTSENPDAVFLYGAGGSSDGLLAKAVRAAGYKGKVIGDLTFASSTIPAEAKSAANSVVGLTAVNFGNPDPAEKAFIDSFKAKYGQEPTVLSAYAYIAVKLAAAGITKAGKFEGPAIAKALSSLTYQSVIGQYVYTSSWHAGPNDPSVFKPVTFNNGAYAAAPTK